jgi:hypothetical protein
MEFENQTECLNCGNNLTAKYCSNCGQKKVQRITFKNLLLLIQRGTLEFRSPLLKTIVGLTIRPADVCREYLDGSRAKYFNPVRYAFWLITFTMIFAVFLNVNMMDASFESYNLDAKASARFDQVKNMIENGLVYFFFVSAFIMALLAKLAFWKEKYNVFELYVVCLLLNGHLCFLSIVLLATGQYSHMYSQIALLIALIIYPAIVIARIYLPRSLWNYIKSLVAVGLGFIVAGMALGFITGFVTGYLDRSDNKILNPPALEITVPIPPTKLKKLTD